MVLYYFRKLYFIYWNLLWNNKCYCIYKVSNFTTRHMHNTCSKCLLEGVFAVLDCCRMTLARLKPFLCLCISIRYFAVVSALIFVGSYSSITIDNCYHYIILYTMLLHTTITFVLKTCDKEKLSLDRFYKWELQINCLSSVYSQYLVSLAKRIDMPLMEGDLKFFPLLFLVNGSTEVF